MKSEKTRYNTSSAQHGLLGSEFHDIKAADVYRRFLFNMKWDDVEHVIS